MFQTKVVEKTKTHALCSITFFSEYSGTYEIMWKNMVERTGQRRMRFACWVTMAKDTHSKYVILIAFPRLQWLSERASMLRCTYIAYLVCSPYHMYQFTYSS